MSFFFVLPASYIVKVLYIYIFIFLKIDTIALYNYTFTHAVLSVILGYTIELNLKGIGCRVGKEKGKLIFNLGYNHSVFLEIPKEITVKFDKNIYEVYFNVCYLWSFANICDNNTKL